MEYRIHYDNIFKSYEVQFFNDFYKAWYTDEHYYPKTGRSYAMFKTQEEAQEFLDYRHEQERELEERYSKCSSNYEIVVPDDYYGVRGRYYGD